MRAAGPGICGALAVLAMCLPATSAAAALEPGVHLDPGSPAEKEYVLPLNAARATGGGSRPASGAASALFGAGITPPSGPSGGASSAARGGAGRSRGQRSTASAAKGTPSPTPVALPSAVLRATRAPNSSAGSGSLLALLGGGLAILVLGGFGGTVLRHSRRPRPSG